MYLYDPKGNALVPIVTEDIRPLTYTQVDRFKDAPIHLVYIADLAKTDVDEGRRYAPWPQWIQALSPRMFICTANLRGGPRDTLVPLHKDKLGEALKLRPTQKIMGAQSVGLPKSK